MINEVVDGHTKYDIVRRQEYSDTVTYQLVVRRLAKTDDGSYTCQVIVVGASENDHPSKTGRLIVLGTYRLLFHESTYGGHLRCVHALTLSVSSSVAV